MKVEDLRSLADRAETVTGRADRRLSEVHARIASSRRRRAAGAAAGATAVVLALVLGVVLVTGPDGQRKSDGPPPPVSSKTPEVVRKIVYSDDLTRVPHKASTPLGRVGTIHVGDEEVRIDQVLRTAQGWALTLTDAGAVYAKDDRTIWLTDGGEPRRIAEKACVDTTQYMGLAAGNAGSWVAWFDCSQTSQGADLVIYDTATGHEVARHPVPGCRGRLPDWPAYRCNPDEILGEHVYFDRNERAFVLDVANGTVSPATAGRHARDVDSNPRGLIIGDSLTAGQRTTGVGQAFRALGSRLVPALDGGRGQRLAKAAFDTATGRAVRLRLPSGYHPPSSPDGAEQPVSFVLFEWLDDGTVALARANAFTHFGEIFVCRLADGSCEVAVEAPSDKEKTRIVVSGQLPG